MKPLHRHLVYTAEDNKNKGDEVQVALPEDFYRPRLVVLPDKQQLPRLAIEENTTTRRQRVMPSTRRKSCCWRVNPAHWLLAYDAYYPAIKGNDSKVEVPVWADEACAIYTAMQAITREMAADARYRKFIGKQDAGNPQQSPFLPVAKWLEERFNAIIAMHSDDDADFRK